MDKYSGMVQKLVSLSIKLVAVDFDLTIINVHTRGSWQFTSKALASRVRPTFKHFLTAALNCNDLHVAVVTQSPQVSLVREVLEQALPDCNTSGIHIRGTDGKWKEVKGVTKEGRTPFIIHAVLYRPIYTRVWIQNERMSFVLRHAAKQTAPPESSALQLLFECMVTAMQDVVHGLRPTMFLSPRFDYSPLTSGFNHGS